MMSWREGVLVGGLLCLSLGCGNGLSTEEAAEVCDEQLAGASGSAQCDQEDFRNDCIACFEACDSCAAVFTACPPTFSCPDDDQSE